MRIIVTGSRDWTDRDLIWHELNQRATSNAVIVHGDCPTGADRMAKDWIKTQPDIIEEAHPADWKRYGRRAGPIRNREMVELNADICLAFIGPCTSPRCNLAGEHFSHGASGCAQMAKDAKIEVISFVVDNYYTSWPLPIHRTEANYGIICSTCDGAGCLDCTDPA